MSTVLDRPECLNVSDIAQNVTQLSASAHRALASLPRVDTTDFEALQKEWYILESTFGVPIQYDPRPHPWVFFQYFKADGAIRAGVIMQARGNKEFSVLETPYPSSPYELTDDVDRRFHHMRDIVGYRYLDAHGKAFPIKRRD